RDEQPAGADEREARHPLRVPHRKLRRDPAAGAVADEIESRQSKRIEQFEIMENHIVDAVALELVAAGAAWMCGRDHPRALRESLVERLEVAGHAMHVGEAMQVEERRAAPGLEHRDLAAAHVEHAHFMPSSCRSMSGNSRANSSAESARSRGATSVAN